MSTYDTIRPLVFGVVIKRSLRCWVLWFGVPICRLDTFTFGHVLTRRAWVIEVGNTLVMVSCVGPASLEVFLFTRCVMVQRAQALKKLEETTMLSSHELVMAAKCAEQYPLYTMCVNKVLRFMQTTVRLSTPHAHSSQTISCSNEAARQSHQPNTTSRSRKTLYQRCSAGTLRCSPTRSTWHPSWGQGMPSPPHLQTSNTSSTATKTFVSSRTPERTSCLDGQTAAPARTMFSVWKAPRTSLRCEIMPANQTCGNWHT